LRLFACSTLLTGLLVFMAVGCGSGGPSTATLSGKVLYKGSVVPGGTITFITDKDVNKQTTFTCPIDGEGKFRAIGLPLDSTAKVGVDTSSAKGPLVFGGDKVPAPGQVPPEVLAKVPEAAKGGSRGAPKKYREIPPKYVDPAKSGITVTITQATQEQNIELP
jgi:hypothetical protein